MALCEVSLPHPILLIGCDPVLQQRGVKTIPLGNGPEAAPARLIALHYGQLELLIVLRHEKHSKFWIGIQLFECSSIKWSFFPSLGDGQLFRNPTLYAKDLLLLLGTSPPLLPPLLPPPSLPQGDIARLELHYPSAQQRHPSTRTLKI